MPRAEDDQALRRGKRLAHGEASVRLLKRYIGKIPPAPIRLRRVRCEGFFQPLGNNAVSAAEFRSERQRLAALYSL